MRRWLRHLALGALALAMLPLQGCELTLFTVSIPDFASKAVDGVWLWRLSPTTGLYERDTQFVFGDTVTTAKGEQLNYDAVATDDSAPFPVSTFLVRDPANPDRVTLKLLYSHPDTQGYYRASTFNVSGDSPLSSEILPL